VIGLKMPGAQRIAVLQCCCVAVKTAALQHRRTSTHDISTLRHKTPILL
jgi:hypothetical protein